jgi:hypothetical protein
MVAGDELLKLQYLIELPAYQSGLEPLPPNLLICDILTRRTAF